MEESKRKKNDTFNEVAIPAIEKIISRHVLTFI